MILRWRARVVLGVGLVCVLGLFSWLISPPMANAADPGDATIAGVGALGAIQARFDGQTAVLFFEFRVDGLWLSAATADGVGEPRRIDPRSVDMIEAEIRELLDLIAKPGGFDATVARRLHAEWLDAALEGLPRGVDPVDRLVLLVDGPLLRLPFGRLIDAEGTPLSARYALSRVPVESLDSWMPNSAAVRASARRGAVLILVDLAEDSDQKTAKRIRREFAGRILTVDEVFIPSFDSFERFSVLHLSGVQAGVAEITRLDLGGRLVVLPNTSAGLESASVNRLTRTLLQSGARSVVLGLWPADPNESTRLLQNFYAGLARGRDVAAALSWAQQLSRRRGESARIWARLAVVGDGAATFEPLLPPRERWLLRLLSGGVIVAMLLAGCSLLWLYLRSGFGFHSPWTRRRR